MSETSVKRTVLLVLFVLALASQAPEGGQAPRVSVNRPLAAARSEATLTSAWQRYELSGSDLRAVDVVDGMTAWAVGTDGLLARWDGMSWTAYDNTGIGPATYNGVDALSVGAAWAVSEHGVVRWNGSAWLAEPTNTASATMYDISMASPADGWIVGSNGTLARYNGASWQVFGSSAVTMTMYGVDAVDPNNAWTVGGRVEHGIVGKIAHWDGTSWTQVLSANRILYAVDMLDATYGWAAGFGGALWQWDGTNWTPSTPPSTDVTIQSISVVSRTDAWAAGSNNDIWHWDGASWRPVAVPGSGQLAGVAVLSATEGWAVGRRGTIYRWNGTNWTVSTSRSTANGYYALDFLDRNDGWAVG